MSPRKIAPLLAAVMAGSTAAVMSPAAPADAGADPTVVASTLDLPVGVTGSATGSAATANQVFNDFPAQGTTYLALSTGDASVAFGTDPSAQLSTDVGNDGQSDSSTLTLTVTQSPGVGCLFIDFALGTEEPVHTYQYSAQNPGDSVSVKRAGDTTEYAMHAGRGFFTQDNWPAAPVPYAVNAVNYWHHPGDRSDPVTGSTEEPRLPRVTGLNSFTTRDTARVPLPFASGSTETVTITVKDDGNGDLDTVAFLDHVRTGSTCGAGTGVEPNPAHEGGVIGGVRGVGNELWYDPIPSTEVIERYDAGGVEGNGWRSPSGVPVELRFRWYRALQSYALNGDMRNWTPIQDADRQSYVPTAADKNYVLIVLVTGFVDGRRPETFPSTGTASTWYSTLQIEDGTFTTGETPTIAGPAGGAAVGDTLTAQIGHTLPREDTYAWEWFADGSPISGANGQSLVLGAQQAGKKITVRATAKRLNFASKSWTSAAYGPIKLQTWQTTGKPTIVTDSVTAYGETVVADPGDGWSPTPDGYSYQWRRDGNIIAGAVSASYTIKTDDVGHQLSVDVAGTKTGYQQVPRTSDTVTVVGATMTGTAPVISGTPTVGQTLNGSVAGWDPSGSDITLTWWSGGTKLQTGPSLTVPAAAVGQPIVLKATGTKAGYEPLTRSSEPTEPVQRGKLTTSTPTISGYPQVGLTLIASPGYWAPSGVKLSYRWKIGTQAVTGKAGAGQQLLIPRTARGKRITLKVTGKLAGYTTVTKTSLPTAKVVR